jgi:hypothetical protein
VVFLKRQPSNIWKVPEYYNSLATLPDTNTNHIVEDINLEWVALFVFRLVIVRVGEEKTLATVQYSTSSTEKTARRGTHQLRTSTSSLSPN